MYRWDDIEVFVTLVRSETMTEAARVLNVTQATVSRRVAILEEALGGALFARTPEGVTPTELGLALLPRAEEMEAAQRALMSEASAYGSAPRGVVTLASTEDLTEHLLVPMLGVFRARHPGVYLNLVTGVELRDMSRLEADLALRFVRPTRDEQRRVARLGAFTFGVYAARSYLDARGAWSAPEELDWIDWSEHLSLLPEAREPARGRPGGDGVEHGRASGRRGRWVGRGGAAEVGGAASCRRARRAGAPLVRGRVRRVRRCA